MDKFFVYILYSASRDSFYIGQSLDLENRLEEHVSHVKDIAFTKRADDWIVYYSLECISRHQAILTENHIKKMKSRQYLVNLKTYPEIGQKLLSKYTKVPGSSR